MARATIREVAREAGVSISSVSRFLSGDYRYRPETEERITQAATRLGYQAHAAARMLRQQSTNLVGIAVRASLMSDPVVASLVAAAQVELEIHGYQPILVEPAHMAPISGNAVFPSPELLQGLLSADFTLEESVPHFYASLKEKLPIVAMYLVTSRLVDCVTTDRQKAIIMAVDHLVNLGHHRIAFASTFDGSISQTPKFRGWRAAQRKFNLDCDSQLIIAWPLHLGAKARDEFVASQLLGLRPLPTAVICSADIIALHLLRDLAERGVKVPDELSVVGFDGHSGGEFSWPALTTIAQPVQAIATAAVAWLVEVREMQSAGETWTSTTKLLKPTLIVRSSTSRVSSPQRTSKNTR